MDSLLLIEDIMGNVYRFKLYDFTSGILKRFSNSNSIRLSLSEYLFMRKKYFCHSKYYRKFFYDQ